MKIGSGTITGRIASPDTGRVKEYELTLKDISTETETAGGEVKGRISSPDTGRVGDYTFTLDEVTIEEESEGELTNGTVTGRIASPDTGNSGTYNLQLKDFQIEGGGGSGGDSMYEYVKIILTRNQETYDDYVYSCDKTWEEIEAAVVSGKQLIGLVDFAELLDGSTHKYYWFPFTANTEYVFDGENTRLALYDIKGAIVNARQTDGGKFEISIGTYVWDVMDPTSTGELTYKAFYAELQGL